MSLCRHSLNLIRKGIIQNGVPVLVNQSSTRNIKRWVFPTLRILKHRRDELGPEPEAPRSSFIEWNYDAELFAFGKRLGEEFKRDVLEQALTHRSYAVQQEIKAEEKGLEPTTDIKDNRELIKIGDDIITHCINVAYQNEYPEVVVKAIHNYLTSESLLADTAKHIGLKDIVLCADFPVENSTLANSFKAVVAAVEKSSGSDRAELFVKDFLLAHLHDKDLFELWNPSNASEHLEGLLKQKGLSSAEPRLCNQSAAATILANYQVGLYCDKKLIGLGWGESIDIAKETAAFDAIKNIYTNRL